MKTLFTTFYYDYNDTMYYKKSAETLKQTIEKLGGRILVHAPKLNGTYNDNCLLKPSIILETLKTQKCNIIWIDADCIVNSLPTEMDNINHDMAAVTRIHDMKTPHSALIFFKYSDEVISFVNDWMIKCNDKQQEAKDGTYKGGDHHLLIETLRERKDIKCVMLQPTVACSVNTNVKVFINISPGGQQGF
jgi:hypothetical protein